MTHIVSLGPSDRGLLVARFEEHDNSHMRMHAALVEAGATEAGERLVALRRIERRYDLDLAEICVLHARRKDACTHPIERIVADFIAEEHDGDLEKQLWVLPDRVRQIRELMEGKLVGEPET